MEHALRQISFIASLLCLALLSCFGPSVDAQSGPGCSALSLKKCTVVEPPAPKPPRPAEADLAAEVPETAALVAVMEVAPAAVVPVVEVVPAEAAVMACLTARR